MDENPGDTLTQGPTSKPVAALFPRSAARSATS